jgi:AmmeMemoRadiSam system protein A
MELSAVNGDALRVLARRSLEDAFDGKDVAVTDEERIEFGQKYGAFVTLKVKGNLRGCIGRLDHEWPVWRKVPELARAAAFEDNRFHPLGKHEMGELDIEVTLLDEPVEVNDLSEVVIGRDGLIVEKNFNKGLLLPQVATEYGWGVEEFLSHTCHKAGLDPDEWKSGGVQVYRFEGIIV